MIKGKIKIYNLNKKMKLLILVEKKLKNLNLNF